MNLKKLYKSKITFPYELIEKCGNGVTRHTTFLNKKQIKREIIRKERAKKNIYKCFFCDKFSKEDKGGRFMPMDKRQSGDNGFGYTYACYRCVPKEFGRL
jgi:hypothetical protein